MGAILVQLPPSLRFELEIAEEFFATLRDLYQGAVVLEPRHASWFDVQVTKRLEKHRVAIVIADPPTAPIPAPSPAPSLVEYRRLHGSPRMYWSSYSTEFLRHVAKDLRGLPRATRAWCVFDNTAAGAAIENALEMAAMRGASDRERGGSRRG